MMSTPSTPDRAAGRLLEPVAAAQQRALARARRADDEDQLLRHDREIDAAQHLDVVERLAQAADVEDGVPRGGVMTARRGARASAARRRVRGRIVSGHVRNAVAREDGHRGRAGRGLDAEPFLVHAWRSCRRASCIRSRSSSVLRSSPEVLAQRRRPDQAGRMQIGQLELRVVLHRPGDDGIAGDIGIGAPDEHRLHRIGLGAERFDLPADLARRARAPTSRRPSPC